MKTLSLLAVSAMLAACSSQPANTNTTNTTTAVEANGVEEVAISESDVAPDNTTANTAGLADPLTGTATTAADAPYLGRWVGVEGMYLNVVAKPGGGVTMDMQWDLDNKGTFDGSVTAKGLRFTRNGVPETAVRSDGDATGLKYLAGKKDCLTVKSGEGYCRP